MNNINKKLLTGILSIGLLSNCTSYTKLKSTDISSLTNPIYSETKIGSGIVSGKIDTKDYTKYDSLSNHYSVFILSEIKGETVYFNYQDKGLHRKVDEDSVVHIIYREVYQKNNYEGIEIQRVVPKSQSQKEGLYLMYPRDINIKLKD